MKNFVKKCLPVAVACLGMVAFAEGESAGFDATTTISTAATTVTAIVTAIGTLLAAAIGVYLAFVGYRKAREALNKA